MAYMLNSQNERIEIKEATSGRFKGNKVLVLYCEKTGAVAPHLLDKATVEFLLKELDNIKESQ